MSQQIPAELSDLLAEDLVADEYENALGASMLRLIRLAATRAPGQVLRGELANAGRQLDQFITAANLE